MDSRKLSVRAAAVVDAIRSGDIDKADREMAELSLVLPGVLPDEDAKIACQLLCEARKLAIVYRAHTMQALQSVIRQQLYDLVPVAAGHTFQVEG